MRDREDAKAAENRLIHGCPKAVREQARAERELAARRIDGHLRGSSEPTEPA